MTFARIRDAFASLDPRGVVFIVLTLDREGYFSGKRWQSAEQAYRELSRMSRALMKRLNRYCKARGWRPIGNRWVSTVEAHRSGWPHVNLMIHQPELALELEGERTAELARARTEREAILLRGELLSHATSTGWGAQSTAERARSTEALAGYLVKLAGQAGRTTGELAKITQAPVNAPVRFRRLRAGKGFLPPRHRNPDVTGTLVRRRRELDGTYTVLPLHESAPEHRETVLACCYQEEQIAVDEHIARRWRESLQLVHVSAEELGFVPRLSVWLVHSKSETGPPVVGFLDERVSDATRMAGVRDGASLRAWCDGRGAGKPSGAQAAQLSLAWRK